MENRTIDQGRESNNSYCARLDLPVPRVEDVLAEKADTKLLHLLVVALLEHGEPMSLEAIADRLQAAGVQAATVDMKTSLLKSWHGRKPVFRDYRDWFALEVSAWELRSIIFELNLQPSVVPSTYEQPQVEPVPDDVSLTEKEVCAAFDAASRDNLSNVRRIAAVLDVFGEPMAGIDVEARLAAWNSFSIRVKLPELQRWVKSCVSVLEGDLLRIDRESPHLFAMRRAVRKLAERSLRGAAINEQSQRRRQAYEVRQAARRKRDRAIAERLRRAILRVMPEKGPPAAAALLDIGTRTIRSFVGPELLKLPAALDEYDLIVALWVRETLYALDIRDHEKWQLTDLKPPQKTRQLNRAGKKLKITPELLISGSTGISRPLADPAKIAAYLANDQQTRLRRRLESDVKSLFAYYMYGLLHRHVRLRWGFLAEHLPVDWALPGDPSLYDILEECRESGNLVEIVFGSAPGWNEPWSRAIRAKIVASDFMTVTVQGSETSFIPRDEIQAIRVLPNSECPAE